MPLLPETVLADPIVQAALRQAWQDSNPGLRGGHETGGFVLQTAQGRLHVVRWPEGRLDAIPMPPHDNCKVEGEDVVASFHTHPNTGPNYHQIPSLIDRQLVRNDPDLKTDYYIGEFVITLEQVYLILQNGRVMVIGFSSEVLGIST